MSTSTFDLSKYSIRETATITIDCASNTTAYFSPPSNAIRFSATVYPKGYSTFDTSNVILFLQSFRMDQPEMHVYFAISLLDVKKEKRFIKGFDWTFEKALEHFYLPIISLAKLTKLAAKLKPNGHLKVVIKASILAESNTFILPAPIPLSTELEPLLQNGKFADVILAVKGTEFKAHKAILSARSPVLAAMFEHDCKESRENRVNILDVEVEVFQELLRYLYTDQVDSLEKYVADLYLAADKYQVESLKQLCIKALIEAITADNMVKLLDFADSHDITELQQQCLSYFADHHKEIMATEDWEGPLKVKHQLYSKLLKHMCTAMSSLMTNLSA